MVRWGWVSSMTVQLSSSSPQIQTRRITAFGEVCDGGQQVGCGRNSIRLTLLQMMGVCGGCAAHNSVSAFIRGRGDVRGQFARDVPE